MRKKHLFNHVKIITINVFQKNISRLKKINNGEAIDRLARKRKHGFNWFQLSLGFAIVAIALSFAYFLGNRSHPVKVPNIEWETVESAKKTLKERGLNLTVKGKFYSQKVPEDHIIEQRPRPGGEIEEGSEVVVSVSKGFMSVTVPDLIGKELKDIGFILENANLKSGRIHEESVQGLSSNIVLRQSPTAGASVPLGSSVEIWLGPQQYVIPMVQGMKLKRAIDMLQRDAFDYKVVSKIDNRFPKETIISQLPEAGTRVSLNSTIYLVVSGPINNNPPGRRLEQKVVCIDPGHQATGSNLSEPIGPGSTTTKPEVASGATGIVSKTPEYEINLQIALKLKSQLEKVGVRVVMTRISSDVNISNVERARIASRTKADLFVRIHCDSSEDKTYHGISTLYPAKNSWTRPIFDRSLRAAELVQKSIIGQIGSGNLGIVPRSDLTGFNWSQVPVILVESGFLSNPFEDKQLNDQTYQSKLATGITHGVLVFLKT